MSESIKCHRCGRENDADALECRCGCLLNLGSKRRQGVMMLPGWLAPFIGAGVGFWLTYDAADMSRERLMGGVGLGFVAGIIVWIIEWRRYR